jgi:hypothetical protein
MSGIPAEGTSYVVHLIAVLVGYFCAKTHGNVVSRKQSLLMTFYLFCFFFLLNVAPGLYPIFVNMSSDVSQSEMPILLMVMFMLLFALLIQMGVLYLFFRGGYHVGLKKHNCHVMPNILSQK